MTEPRHDRGMNPSLCVRTTPQPVPQALGPTAATLESLVVETILTHLGLDPQPPPRRRRASRGGLELADLRPSDPSIGHLACGEYDARRGVPRVLELLARATSARRTSCLRWRRCGIPRNCSHTCRPRAACGLAGAGSACRGGPPPWGATTSAPERQAAWAPMQKPCGGFWGPQSNLGPQSKLSLFPTPGRLFLPHEDPGIAAAAEPGDRLQK
jgi:hypothetical protein